MSNMFSLFQLIGGIIMSVGYIPQISQILKTKSSEGLNSRTFAMIFTGILLYEIYAVSLVLLENSGHMYLITNSVSTFLSGLMYLLIRIFKNKEKKLYENQ